MKKSTLLTIVALVLALAMGVTGTMAYLQDTDADVNVMTLGNVTITQNEQEWNNGALIAFTKDKPLYPYVGEFGWTNTAYENGAYRQFTMNNVVDKYVTVTNTGKSPAYVRTLIALEMGAYETLADFATSGIGLSNNAENGTEFQFPGAWVWTEDFMTEINGQRYNVMVAEHQDALEPGDTTIPSLLQLYLSKTAGNEEVEKLDGNGNGAYDVLVLSQAVQTMGFVDASQALAEAFPYGDNFANVPGWFGDLKIGTPGDKWPNNNPPVLDAKWAPETDDDKAWYGDGTSTEYTITTPGGLAYLAELVNSGKDNFKGETVYLAGATTFRARASQASIDLGGKLWTPIGTSSNPFKGHFDGQNVTINNLIVNAASSSNQGLFGHTTEGSVKNVHVNNANVTGRLNVGVVAGSPYTSTYENIKVTGQVQVNGMSYVGGVFGKNVYANVSNVTVDVSADSYVRANSVENGTAYRTYVGGVIGFMGEGTHVVSNVKSNIDVFGSTCDVGGITGIVHYGNRFVNCSSSGDVNLFNGSEADECEEIGGIAGVWHNENGTTTHLVNCSYTGKLTANITEGVDLSDNTLTGKAYSESGTGELIIDGARPVKPDAEKADDATELKAALKGGNDVVLNDDIQTSETESNSYGKTGFNQLNGGVLDGQGNTLSVTGADTTWDSAINTTGGTIKNLTIDSGFRGIFVNHNENSKYETVYLSNVTIDGPVYTISCDQGTNNGLIAANSTFNGWTSYAATIGNVSFMNCSFGEGAGYAYMRPYAPTELVNCHFEKDYKIDARAKVTLINCYLDGVLITNDNVGTLVTSNVTNATVK